MEKIKWIIATPILLIGFCILAICIGLVWLADQLRQVFIRKAQKAGMSTKYVQAH